MSIDVDALMMALQAQRAGAEAAIVELGTAAGRWVTEPETQAASWNERGVDDAAVRALAVAVLDDLGAWSEMWRGVASRGAAPAPGPGPAPDPAGDTTDEQVKPRKMMGVSPLMGMGANGMSELRSAIGSRKSAPSAMETATSEREKTGPGVVVAPATEPTGNASSGKPAWMVELAAKKKVKELAEAALGR